jgi:hypothetical protein
MFLLLTLSVSLPGVLLALAAASVLLFGTFSYPTPATYTGSKSQSSQGTLIYVNATATSPPTWVEIGEPKGAQFSDKNEFDDATNLQSTAKEFVATLADPGKLNVDLNRVSTDAGQAAVLASYHATPAPTKLQYLVVFPINTAAGQTSYPDARMFSAYVESMSPDIKTNKIIGDKFTLQISGPITEIEGS